jgi:hypothetical protein
LQHKNFIGLVNLLVLHFALIVKRFKISFCVSEYYYWVFPDFLKENEAAFSAKFFDIFLGTDNF